MARAGGRPRLGGTLLVAPPPGGTADVAALAAECEPQGIRVLGLDLPPQPDEAWAGDILTRLA